MSFWISLTWLKLPFNIRAIFFWNIKFFSHVFFGTFKFHIHKSLFSPCHQVFTVTAPYRALAPETADPSRFGCRQLPVHRAQFEETHSAGPHLCGETRNKMDGSGGLCHMSYVWWCVMYVIYIYIYYIYIIIIYNYIYYIIIYNNIYTYNYIYTCVYGLRRVIAQL